MSGENGDLQRDGFTVLRSVLDADEVCRLRGQVDAALERSGLMRSGGRALPDAAAEAPEIGWLLTHPKILGAVRAHIGTDHLAFTHETDLHRNIQAGRWHKDSGEQVMTDGYFGHDAIGDEDCQVYKVAVYLQDHSNGGGLNVRPGSHRSASLVSGDGVSVRTGVGDAVLFDVRITHRGVPKSVADRLIGVAALAGSPGGRDGRKERLRRLALRAHRQSDRLAVYFAVGVANENTRQFSLRNMRRQRDQLGRPAAHLGEPLLGDLAAAGLQVVEL